MLAPLAERRFLALYLSQIATQVGANALLYALTVEITTRTAGSATAVGAMLWAFLLPTVIAAIPAGVFVDRADARRILVASNLLRAILIGALALLIIVAAPLALIYPLVVPIAVATSFFAPAELAMLPRVVAPDQLVRANGLFTITMNASFAVGFSLVGPYLVGLAGGTTLLIAVVAILYLFAALACRRLPAAPSVLVLADRSDQAGARSWAALARETRAQLRGALELIRANRLIRWSIGYLAATGALIGGLAVLGPVYALEIGLTPAAFGLVILPLGLGLVLTSAALDRLIRLAGERLVVHGGLAALGLGIAGLGAIGLVRAVIEAIGGITPLGAVIQDSSLILAIVSLAALAGAGFAAAAIPSQAALSREVPPEARGRVFGALNMIVSLASIAPTVLLAPLADLLGPSPVILLLAAGVAVLLAGSLYGRWGEVALGSPEADAPLVGLASGGAAVDAGTDGWGGSGGRQEAAPADGGTVDS